MKATALWLTLGCASTAHESLTAVRARADASYRDKDFAACAARYTQAARRSPPLRSDDVYNAACCYALAGDTAHAAERLREALERGYRDPVHLQQDADLERLHADLRWAGWVGRARSNRETYERAQNPELLTLYEADQADRALPPERIDWRVVGPRDAQRLARVKQLVRTGGLHSADDFFHAAMVLQHGPLPDDTDEARRLALRAVELDPAQEQAKWLAAAALDRSLMRRGKPQRFGTQFLIVDGKWQLYQVDPAVSDEERERWNVPPLAQAQARAASMNAGR
jgi:hypothetical protein